MFYMYMYMCTCSLSVSACGGDTCTYETVAVTLLTACLCVGLLLITAVHSLPMIPYHYTGGGDCSDKGS